MADASGNRRTDTASRIIGASPQAIYQAFVDPAAHVAWLPPSGMTGRLLAFEPREGGRYRLVLSYDRPDHPVPGKASEHDDIVEGRFLELVRGERIVQAVEFVSEDAAFAGTMTVTWSLAPVPAGTRVTILCENVPAGIRREDHDQGLTSTLANLAAFVERPAGR